MMRGGLFARAGPPPALVWIPTDDSQCSAGRGAGPGAGVPARGSVRPRTGLPAAGQGRAPLSLAGCPVDPSGPPGRWGSAPPSTGTAPSTGRGQVSVTAGTHSVAESPHTPRVPTHPAPIHRPRPSSRVSPADPVGWNPPGSAAGVRDEPHFGASPGRAVYSIIVLLHRVGLPDRTGKAKSARTSGSREAYETIVGQLETSETMQYFYLAGCIRRRTDWDGRRPLSRASDRLRTSRPHQGR